MGAPSEYDFQNLGVHLHDPFPHVFFLLKKKKEGAVTVRSILAKSIILPQVIPAQKKRKEKPWVSIHPSNLSWLGCQK